jgi:hypothetical protein
MRAQHLPGLLVAFVVACGTIPHPGRAATDADNTQLKPPQIRFVTAGPIKLGEGRFILLSFHAINPNAKPVAYVGYTADSFGPPLKDGQIAPIHKVELKRDGKWQEVPRGWCGTGIGRPTLPPGRPQNFAVTVPEDGWQAVRVGFRWFSTADADDSQAKMTWSEAVEQRLPLE